MDPKKRKPLYEVNEGLEVHYLHLKQLPHFEVHYLQFRQLPHFKPENMRQYSPAELWGFFLSLESEADRGRLLDMGKAYQQALEAWNTLSQDQHLREKQWQLEAAEADYLISMSEAQKEGIEIGQKKGREEGIEIGRKELITNILQTCTQYDITIDTDMETLEACAQYNIEIDANLAKQLAQLSFSHLIKLYGYISFNKSLPSTYPPELSKPL